MPDVRERVNPERIMKITWAARKGYIVVSSGGGGKGDTVNEVSFLYMRWDVEWL